MIGTVNDIVKATGKYLSKTFPGYAVYDQYPEEGMELPGFIIELSTNHTQPRVTGRRRLVSSLVLIKAYANDARQIRDMVGTVLLTLREIELPDGPALAHRVRNSHITDSTATVSFQVLLDMEIDQRNDPLMRTLNMNERINQ